MEEITNWMDKNNLTMDEALEMEEYRCYLQDQIYRLYKNIIVSYQSGEKEHYHPKILDKLDYVKFFNWILNNNPNIKKVFEWEHRYSLAEQ